MNVFSSKQLSHLCSAIAKSHIVELILDDIEFSFSILFIVVFR